MSAILGSLNPGATTNTKNEDTENMFDKLHWYNLAAAVLHAILALVIIVLEPTIGIPYQMSVSSVFKETNASLLNPAFSTPVCNGTTFTDFFKWTTCIEASGIYLPSEESAAFFPHENVLFTTPIWTLLLVYEIITSGSHFFCFFKSEVYEYFLSRQMQPIRWCEYSLTSSLMTIVLLGLSDVVDIFLLFAIFLLNAC